jgi:hypothetical protein
MPWRSADGVRTAKFLQSLSHSLSRSGAADPCAGSQIPGRIWLPLAAAPASPGRCTTGGIRPPVSHLLAKIGEYGRLMTTAAARYQHPPWWLVRSDD